MRGAVWIASGLLVFGCGRGSAARDRAADSTAAVVPAPHLDSSSAMTDSTSASVAGGQAPAKASTKTPTKTPTKPPAPPLTGYDSAFGPTFTVDSTGKVTPIGKKKP